MKFSAVLSRLFIAALISCLFCSVAVGESKRFEGKGVAPLESYDVRSARTLAIKRGVRSALEEAVGSLLNPKIFNKKYDLLDREIFSGPKKFITDTVPLSEARKGESYEVVVWAVVDMSVLRAHLVKIGLLLPPEKMPRCLVVITQRVNDGPPRSAWIDGEANPSTSEAEYRSVIEQYGYRIVRPGGNNALPSEVIEYPMERIAKIIKAAEEMGATHVLVGENYFYSASGINRKDYHLGTARLELTAVEVATGKTVGKSDAHIALELPDDARLDEKVVRAVCNKLRDEVTGWLHAINPSGAAGFDEVCLRFSGFTSYSSYEALIASLERDIPGVRKVVLMGLAHGEATAEVRYAGEGSVLVRKLIEHKFKGFDLELEGKAEGEFLIKVIPRPDQ